MRIVLASDHAGVEQRKALHKELTQSGYDCAEMGSRDASAADDYPDFAAVAARKVADGEADRAVCICGTGIGMSIATNKIPGIRAAVCWDEFTATVSRSHNNANVLCLGGRTLEIDTMVKLAKLWMQTEFEGGRHAIRVKKIADLERPGR